MIMLVYILSNLMITSVAVILWRLNVRLEHRFKMLWDLQLRLAKLYVNTKEGKNVTIYMKSEYGIWIDEETGNFRVEEPRP